MDEVIVEGLEPKDFDILEKILKTYPLTLESEVTYNELYSVYHKIKQVQDHIK